MGKPQNWSSARKRDNRYYQKSEKSNPQGLDGLDEEYIRYLQTRESRKTEPEKFIQEMAEVPHTVENFVGGRGEGAPNRFVYYDKSKEPKLIGEIIYPWNAPAYVIRHDR